MDTGQPKSGLTQTQKTGFVLLLIFGILAVGLGVLQLRNVIYGPFAIHLAANNEVGQLFLDEETRLQSIDTDHDGLNDYEELAFYETSPYLPDTDSDGIGDKVEIEQGTDPLCPKGEFCETVAELPPIDNEPLTSPLAKDGGVTPLDILEESGLFHEEDKDISDIFSDLQDPNKIRQTLLDTGGITEAELNKIDDETLLSMVNELLGEQLGATSDELKDLETLTNLAE